MNFVLCLVIGVLLGAATGRPRAPQRKADVFPAAVVAAVGAIIGGLGVAPAITGTAPISDELTWTCFVGSVLGALVLLAACSALLGKKR
jgi:uncharacterized membrane protein YeaQ/YmgE (transglycosylase-associated protein family)